MLTLHTSIRSYFREALTDALQKKSVSLTDYAQVYIVNLLSEFARADNVYAGVDRHEKTSMVQLLIRAQEADPAESVRIYKHMGDSSLYFTGFFSDQRKHETVSHEYYQSMGESAYRSVSALVRTQTAAGAALFAELADCFSALSDLLTSMSLYRGPEKKVDFADQELLSLFERYQRTGKKEFLDALQSRGILLRPSSQGDDTQVH